ncbi:MAG: hypothetical protein CR982_04335 [Candidatus Cloacimonadota bacterium]|nr:MAG: hypothetical protein CR982_04335 [Candidatus Cloacimonadota bacterium]PIE78853.1 MAG: hypothetical protein CSA15_05725 [Candidatus Delongbacteria bacterium]
MKKVYYIPIITIIFIILGIALYLGLKTYVMSDNFKTKVEHELSEALENDSISVRSANLIFNRAIFENIDIKMERFDLFIGELSVEVGFLSPITKGFDLSKWFKNIEIADIKIILKGEYQNSISDGNIIETDTDLIKERDYLKVLKLLQEISYIKRAKVSNFGIYLKKNKLYRFIENLSGRIYFVSNELFKLKLDANFLGSMDKNLKLTGYINLETYISKFNIDLDRTKLKKRFFPSDIFISNGELFGGLQLLYSRSGSDKFQKEGNLNIKFDSLSYKNLTILERLKSSLTLENDSLFFDDFTSYHKGGRIDLVGGVENINKPELKVDIKIDSLKNIDLPFNGLELSGSYNTNSSCKLFYNFDDSLSAVGFANINNLKFNDREPKSISFEYFSDGKSINVDSLEISCKGVSINGKGYSTFSGKGNFFLNSAGDLSKFIGSDILKSPLLNFSTLSLEFNKENISYDLISDFYNKSLNRNSSFSIIAKGDHERVDFKVRDNLSANGEGWYIFNGNDFSLNLENFEKLFSLIKKDLELPNSSSLEFEKIGNKSRGKFEVLDRKSPLWGEYLVNSEGDTKSFTSKVRASNHYYGDIPINLNLHKEKDDISIKGININGVKLKGNFNYSLKSDIVNCFLHSDSLDFGKLSDSENFTTNTNVELYLYNTLSNLKGDLFINEKGIESAIDPLLQKVTGEVDISLRDSLISVDRGVLFNSSKVLAKVTGYYKKDLGYSFNLDGDLDLNRLGPFLGMDIPHGRVDYNLYLEGKDGRPDSLSFSGSSKRLKFGDFDFYDFGVDMGGDSNNLYLKNLSVFNNIFKETRAKGVFSYNLKDNISLETQFDADLLKFAGDNSSALSNCSSSVKGNLSIGGTLLKPKLKSGRFDIDKGILHIDDIVPKISDINGTITIKNDSVFIDTIRATTDNKQIFFRNRFGVKGFEDIKLPLNLNGGTIELEFPDGPIKARIPGFMEDDVYGEFLLKGFNDSKFRIGKRNGIYTISGKGIIDNVRVTYPIIDDNPDVDDDNIFDYVWFDVEVVPNYGNIYHFNANRGEDGFFRKLVSAFSLSENKTLNRASIPINSSENGLFIEGMYMNSETFDLKGKIKASGGEVGFSALNFDIVEALLDFDRDREGSKVVPFLSGTGKTVIVSREDSLSLPEYEDLYIHIVTREGGNIIDRDGAYINDFSIDIVDSDGKSWLDTQQDEDEGINAFDGENTANTLFNNAVDTKVFKTFLDPIELAIGDMLGGFLTIRPSFTKNILDDDNKEIRTYNYIAGYFEGSEIFFTKFLTNTIGLNLYSKFIGEKNYLSEIDKDYGVLSSASLEFRFGRHLVGSIGYQYDSLEKDGGYLFSIRYRYKFSNLKEELKKLKKSFYDFMDSF